MISIEFASESDLPVIREMIGAADLPLDGLGQVDTTHWVARVDDEIVGTVSLETHGDHALLRSLAVAEHHRRKGIGSLLAAAAERHAAAAGLDAVYLLTETADGFFAGRGYSVIGRDAGPEPVMASVEWSTACGDNAVPMVLVSR